MFPTVECHMTEELLPSWHLPLYILQCHFDYSHFHLFWSSLQEEMTCRWPESSSEYTNEFKSYYVGQEIICIYVKVFANSQQSFFFFFSYSKESVKQRKKIKWINWSKKIINISIHILPVIYKQLVHLTITVI